MDFFAEQARQRVASRKLAVLFALAVLAIVALVDGVVGALWYVHSAFFARVPHVDMKWLVVVTLAVAGGILACSFHRMLALSAGGRAVAESVRAERVPAESADPRLRRLRNVVEEMAVAAGVPVPGLYVMADESAINAFAAGLEPRDAVICVTQGCLDHLSHDELQGVVAHELSHVLNGDMRMNIRIMGLLFGIQALGILGRYMLDPGEDADDFVRRRETRPGLPLMALGAALMAIGYVGVVAGRIIQAALSRSRESLADASAVQFTRQADGLAGALKKVASIDESSYLCSGRRGELAHMLFAEGDEPRRLFATHPPVLDRIRALEPGFSATALKLFAARYAASLTARDGPAADPAPGPAAFPRISAPPPESLGLYTRFGAAPAGGAMPSVPSLSPETLPPELVRAARDPETAQGLVLAYALSSEWALRDGQARTIAAILGDAAAEQAKAVADSVAGLALKPRQLLLALAVPPLRQLPSPRRGALLHTADLLVRADGRMELREYVLLRFLRAQLRDGATSPLAPATARKLHDCRESYALVGAVLACHGSVGEAEARQAWWQAMQEALPGEALAWPSLPALWQDAFDRALDELDQLSPMGKELAVQGLLRAAQADGEVTSDEAQLLRLICASLHCAPPSVLATA
jgi:Zn-dependent protease with chaperone function